MNTRPGAATRSSRLERWLLDDAVGRSELLVMGLLAALISLAFTRFRFSVSNNVFHIPYVLDLASKPEFAQDQFYQTLKYFTSIVWPVIRLFATDANVKSIFLVAHILSRAGAFVAIAFLLGALDVRRRGAIALGLVIMAATPWLQNNSDVGAHGMFITIFTHSEVTWPFIIGALLCTMRGRLVAAAVLTAITVSINAFVGFWLVAIVGVCVLICKPRPTLLLSMKAAAAFLVVAAPIAIWIVSAIDIPHPVVAFSFREYVRYYYPGHFLIEAAAPLALCGLASLLISAMIATKWVANGHFWRVVLLAAASIFGVGAVLPYIFDSRLIFNLHFLRVAGVIVFFSVSIIIGGSLNQMCRARTVRGRILWALTLVAVLCNQRAYVPELVLALFVCHEIFRRWSARGIKGGVVGRAPADDGPMGNTELYEGGVALVLWSLWLAFSWAYVVANPATVVYLMLVPAGFCVVFLVPLQRAATERTAAMALSVAIFAGVCLTFIQKLHGGSPSRAPAVTASNPLALADWLRAHPVAGAVLLSRSAQVDDFQLRARVSVWVDWKQGAAVMWYPPFFQQWSTRYREVADLSSLEQLLSYARANDIRYFIGTNDNGHCPAGSTVLKEDSGFILCAVGVPLSG